MAVDVQGGTTRAEVKRAFLRRLARDRAGRARAFARTSARGVKASSWYLDDLDQLLAQAAERGVETPVEPFPQLQDRSTHTPFDAHYTYQGAWAFRHLHTRRPDRHVDVGSSLQYLGFFSAVTPTTFIDLRPSGVDFPGLEERAGSVLELPYADGELPSVSCLHVIEHIGLGRYGDPVDIDGSRAACAELGRVVAPGGELYLSTPVGRPTTYFNAHRVHAPEQIEAAVGLPLTGFDAVLDDGTWVTDADPASVREARYALGLFRFTR